jgi:hypothetical protein
LGVRGLSSTNNNTKKWQDADETGMHQILEYHCKGVVIDLPACEQCYSLFAEEAAFYYTPEAEIRFEKAEISYAFDYTVEAKIRFEKAEISFEFDYDLEAEIRFEKASFHLSNGNPNVEQHIVTYKLIAWNARTMKDNLVNFESRFKYRLFLEDWKRSKLKESVTSE